MDEREEGYVVERRRLLWMAPLALVAFRARLEAAPAEAARLLPGLMDWDAFLEAATGEARAAFDPAGYDEEAYLHRLASTAVRLKALPEDARTFRFGGLEPPVEFGPAYRGAPFAIIQWRLAPHACLPPHNHPHYNVLTVGLEGEATVTHYEIDGDAPAFESEGTFRVRRTRTTLIAPRRVSSLTTARDNIHTFRASSAGARGFDVVTLNTVDIGFSFLEIGDAPIDADRGVYGARWRKRP